MQPYFSLQFGYFQYTKYVRMWCNFKFSRLFLDLITELKYHCDLNTNNCNRIANKKDYYFFMYQLFWTILFNILLFFIFSKGSILSFYQSTKWIANNDTTISYSRSTVVRRMGQPTVCSALCRSHTYISTRVVCSSLFSIQPGYRKKVSFKRFFYFVPN